ncbi:MAG: hypothetical protein WC911_03560 [Thermoleophilia bacterium]
MGYCDITDIESRLSQWLSGNNLSEDTRPTRIDVEGFITDIAAELDAIIAGHNLTVPVTNTTAVAALKGYNATGASAIAANAMFPGQVGANDKAYGAELEKSYQTALKRLEAPQHPIIMLLKEATSSTGPESNYTRDPDADGMEPVITKDMVF